MKKTEHVEADAAAAIAILADANGWIAVEDALPPVNILAEYQVFTDWRGQMVAQYKPTVGRWVDFYGHTITGVTHWRGLFNPPEVIA